MANKTHLLQIRLSEHEKRLVAKSAKDQGMGISTWVRLVLLNANLRNLLGEIESKPKRARKAAQ